MSCVADAFYRQWILKAALNAMPMLNRAGERYKQFQNNAINDTKCPVDFCALNFAYLILFSSLTVVVSGDMSNIFFSDEYGWGWYIVFFVLSVPISYIMGLLVVGIGKVAFHRLNKEFAEERCEQCADNRRYPASSIDQAQKSDAKCESQ